MNLCRTPPPPSLKYVSGAPGDWPPKWRHPGGLSVDSPRGSAQSTKGDWLFGPAKGEWNRDAYFIKMYKVKNCLEKKIGFLLSRPLSVEFLPICSIILFVPDSFHQSKGLSISPLLYSVLSAALSRSVQHS